MIQIGTPYYWISRYTCEKFTSLMKYLVLFILILIGCTPYHKGIVIEKSSNAVSIECEITPLHYILPNVSIEQWDSIQVGDTLYINKKTLRLLP